MEKKTFDIATLFGVFLGFGLIGGAIYLSGSFHNFYDLAGIMIVFGGTSAATLINYPFAIVLPVFKVASRALFSRDVHYMKYIHDFSDLAQVIRTKGPVEIDKRSMHYQDKFMARALKLVSDDMKEEKLREILEMNIMVLQERHKIGQDVMKSMGKWAPAFGIIGTVIGLIGMMATMSEPDKIGPQMAIALLTTFYGLLLSNLIFLPIAGKLKHNTDMEVLKNEMILEGAMALKGRASPSDMVEKLKAFISSDQQLKLYHEAGGKI